MTAAGFYILGLSSCNTTLFAWGHLCSWLRRTSPCSRCRRRSANFPWCRRHEHRWTLLGRTGETLNKQTKTIGATVSEWIPSVWSLLVWINIQSSSSNCLSLCNKLECICYCYLKSSLLLEKKKKKLYFFFFLCRIQFVKGPQIHNTQFLDNITVLCFNTIQPSLLSILPQCSSSLLSPQSSSWSHLKASGMHDPEATQRNWLVGSQVVVAAGGEVHTA